MENDLKLTMDTKHKLAIRKRHKFERTIDIVMLIAIALMIAFISLVCVQSAQTQNAMTGPGGVYYDHYRN